jgi:hypothetical protein
MLNKTINTSTKYSNHIIVTFSGATALSTYRAAVISEVRMVGEQ